MKQKNPERIKRQLTVPHVAYLFTAMVTVTGLTGCVPESPSLRLKKAANHFVGRTLRLSPEQSASMEGILNSGLEAHKEITPINKAIFDEVMKALDSGQLDQSLFGQLIEKRNRLEAKLALQQLSGISSWLAALNPHQRKEALKLVSTFRERSRWFQFILGEIE
jgi:hypothetical protein